MTLYCGNYEALQLWFALYGVISLTLGAIGLRILEIIIRLCKLNRTEGKHE